MTKQFSIYDEESGKCKICGADTLWGDAPHSGGCPLPVIEGGLLSEKLLWIVTYILDEGFSNKYLEAIVHIVGLFNCCADSEREVFEFAERFYEKHGGKN